MRRYATFSGRSTRTEFWYYHLVFLVIAFAGLVIDVVIAGPSEPQPLVSAVIVIALYLPSLAIIIRRLHDLEKSGWLVLTCLIPLVGIIAFIVIGSAQTKGADEAAVSSAIPPVSRPTLYDTEQQIERIGKLAALRASGAVTDEEFERMPRDVIEGKPA